MTVSEQLSALDKILAHGDLNTLFQPILCLSEQRIYGYEALTRGPSNSPLHAPLPLFSAARHAGRLSELERLCRKTACERFRALGLDNLLFLNVCPELLLEPDHQPGRTLELLASLNIPPERVVIELTEQMPIDDFGLLHAALHHYRAMGFSIALDDLGAGYSSLRLWSELRPDYVKIDRHFIDGIDRDPVKREFVDSILNMARASRAKVIAEGIERSEELATLLDMGVDLIQGYLLARPQEFPVCDVQQCLSSVRLRHPVLGETDDLAALLIEQPTVPEQTPVLQVLDLFRGHPALSSLAVLDEHRRPVGIVHRHLFSEALLKPFASELFARKPISRLMSSDFLAVEHTHSLQQVSRLLTSRANQRIEENFIINQDGCYLGIGRAIDVLAQITEQKIQQARHANPLTQLPGNVPIQQHMTQLLNTHREALICYIDIDNFKPFNDSYDYAKGDEALLRLAQCLSRHGDPQGFLGHIGGDDFILVLRCEDWRQRLQRLQNDFQSECRQLYRSEHLCAGGYSAEDRLGRQQHFGLLSLSLGVVHLHPEACAHLDADQIAALLTQAKQQAKAIVGDSLAVIDTRNWLAAQVRSA
jgi:EAL domain-containing protein (putative c-di-GMP-specific phosphodiesterase class I)/GGDEF domain-containing protein